MECYACTNEPTRQCRRCARVYCEVHGGDLCGECLSPGSTLPSFNLYRGSLLALLVGTAVALWLLVRPPGSSDSQEVLITQFTPTPIVTTVSSTPTARLISETETATPRTSTPGADTTGTPSQSTATPEPREYVVQEGDTLIDIADRLAPPGVDPFEYAQQIAFANGQSIDDPIQEGDILLLP